MGVGVGAGGRLKDWKTREGGRREPTWVGAAFTGLCLVHKFPFDPTGDGFPSFGSWMSRDRG